MYENFADIYDEFMQEIPAESWADYAETLWKRHGLKPHLVLDLCCGTGSLAMELCRRGYDLIGADGSAEMLDQAGKKLSQAGMQDQVLLLLQDMREFELYGTVRAIVSVCDTLNYLTQEEDLLKVFQLAENYLDPGGLFLFDMNTAYKYEKIIGDTVIAENRDDASFIWENSYDAATNINECFLTLFVRREGNLFERSSELHVQRAYTQKEVHRLLREAGLTMLSITEAYTGHPPKPESERLLFVAQKRRDWEGEEFLYI